MEAIKNTIVENLGGAAHNAASPEQSFDLEKDIPSQSGKVCTITGGTEGIGYGCTYYLLKNGAAKVFCLAKRQEVFDGAKNDIAERLGQDHAEKMVFMPCDLADWKAVTETASQIRKQTDRLDVVILAAAYGIMPVTQTSYGVDMSMAVNHFGHVTLASHLMPLLQKTAEKDTVRVVAFCSNAHEMAPKDTTFADLDDINRDAGPNGQYGRSKLAQLLYARYMARQPKTSNILFNAVHPGIVATKASEKDIHEAFPIMGYGMSHVMQPFKKDQFAGAASALYCATAIKDSGKYMCPPKIEEPGSKLANDAALGDQLMKFTREIVSKYTKSDSVDKGCPFTFA